MERRDTEEKFVLSEVGELDNYQRRERVYTRKVDGFFQRIRLFTGWPLLLAYFLLPWFEYQGRQSVLFDLPARKFHIFSVTFWPQDFILLSWLLIIAAFSLFSITVLVGRVWCGYTCPQTIWTCIYMWIEQVTEGDRNQRIKLDRSPWSFDKVSKKFLKHSMWLGFAFITAVTFVGYFTPIRELVPVMAQASFGFWPAVWVLFFTVATYVNAGWMREQLCIFICPYARFQSVMLDTDTLMVVYDAKRGEPRGSRKHGIDPKQQGLGDCIDCRMCVQVCPVGLDVRSQLMHECINCALCVDACNLVMDKMNYSRGLISYTTTARMEGEKKRLLRPKVVGYMGALLVIVTIFVYSLASRVPLGLDVIRERSQLYQTNLQGVVENVYTLKIRNMDQHPHTYKIGVSGIKDVQFAGAREVAIGAGEILSLPLRLLADSGQLDSPNIPIIFSVVATDSEEYLEATAESRFISSSLADSNG